jgi:hypothetical protein
LALLYSNEFKSGASRIEVLATLRKAIGSTEY